MKLTIAGIGPGSEDGMTVAVRRALEQAEQVVGYDLYVDLVRQFLPDKEYYSTPMRSEKARVEYAVRQAAAGKETVLICSGDPGVYGMASLAMETADRLGLAQTLEIRILPGVTAALSAAALAGSPLTCDFAVISLSDLMVPWSLIEQRLEAAARGDLAIALYNPGSRKRTGHLERACRIIMQYRGGGTVCAIVENIGRAGENCRILTLEELAETSVGMTVTVLIGCSFTREMNGRMVTPRGYADEYESGANDSDAVEKGAPDARLDHVLEKDVPGARIKDTAGACTQQMPGARGSILLFGGTAEGRELAETALQEGFQVTVSVVSEYGEEVLEPLTRPEPETRLDQSRPEPDIETHPSRPESESSEVPVQKSGGRDTADRLRIVRGKMLPEQILEFMRTGAFDFVIDATHPYAASITESVQRAAEQAPLPYFRVQRDLSSPGQLSEIPFSPCGQPSDIPVSPCGQPSAMPVFPGGTPPAGQARNGQTSDGKNRNILSFSTMEQIIDYLNTCEGRVFFSTGSAGAAKYAHLQNAAERAVIRILPSEEAIAICRRAGFRGKNLICMQGPFDQEMNEACFRFARADYLVTKSAGERGGFDTKIRAARALGMQILMLEPPAQTEGITLEQMTERLKKWKKQ